MHSTYYEGISTPPDDKFTEQELKEIEEKQKAENEQQYAHRQVERFDRLSKYSLDKDNKRIYAARKEAWEEKEQLVSAGDENIIVRPITQKIIDRIKIPFLEELSEEKNMLLQDAHKKVLSIAMKDNHSWEVGMLLDEAMETIDVVKGTSSEIDLNVAGRGRAKYVIHNHPNNKSFSDLDIVWIMKNPQVNYFSIVKNDGSVEVIYITDKFRADILEIEYRRIYKKYKKDIDNNEQKGYDKLIKKLLESTKSGLKYVR